MNIKVVIISVCIFSGACATIAKKSVNEESYKKWLSENISDITDTLTVNNVHYSLRIYPYDLDLLRISDPAERAEAAQEVHTAIRSGKMLRFALRTELPVPSDIYSYKTGLDSPQDDRSRYFAFDIQKDIKLITKSNDTLKCSKVTTERPISGYPVSLFLIEFEGIEQAKIKELIIDDRFLARTLVSFNVSGFSSVSIPELTINN